MVQANLFEVNSVLDIMNKPSLNDNSPELQLIVHRLQRVVTILRVLVQQIDILETMTAMGSWNSETCGPLQVFRAGNLRYSSQAGVEIRTASRTGILYQPAQSKRDRPDP